MTLESALNEYEYECWCDYNYEHKDEYGNWVNDEPENK